MEISSIKPKTVYVQLSATFDINDKLPIYIIEKLKALGIPITKNMTEAEALALIEEKEEKIRKEKLKKIKKELVLIPEKQDEMLLKSLQIMSENNKVSIKCHIVS